MILKVSTVLSLVAGAVVYPLSNSKYDVDALSFSRSFTSSSWNRFDVQPYVRRHRFKIDTLNSRYLSSYKASPTSTINTEPIEDYTNKKSSSQTSYTREIIAYTRNPDEQSTQQALETLERMEKLNTPSDPYLYNLVLSSFAKLGNIHGANELLLKMIHHGIANTVSYNTCIHAYAKYSSTTHHPTSSSSSSSHSNMKNTTIVSPGQAAENLLLSMESNPTLQPDVITYSSTIAAIIRSKEPQAAERAENILQRMFEISEKDMKHKVYNNIQPNTITLNTILHAWATSGQVDGPSRAEIILQKMELLYESNKTNKLYPNIQPNTISYTTVIDAYAKSKLHDAALHAERIFKQMEKVYTDGNKQAKPNVQSFNTVINAWALSKQSKGAARAESILKKMIALNVSGDFDIQPNVVSFTTVISAWGKSGEVGSANRAEQIFQLMQEEYKKGNILAKPNSFTYSALVDAWLKAKDPESVLHGQNIYDQLEQAFRQGETDVIPSTILLTGVIDAWSQSGDFNAGDKAEALLFKQRRLFNDYKIESMRPNNQCYAATINAIAKSRQFGKAEKANMILNQMIHAYKEGDRNARPTVHAFTAVISACAYTLGESSEKKKALDIATTVFKAMPEYAQPNEITYGTFLKACTFLIPKGLARDSAICTVFRHCCSNGQVGHKVIEIIEKTLSRDLIEKLTKVKIVDGNIKQSDLPMDWSRNVDKATVRINR